MNPYMATKKTGPTLAALNAQIAKLQAQAEALRAKEVAGVVARIREAIVHYGLTVADLGLGSAKSKAPKGAAVTATSKSKGKAAGKKTARTIKFADGKGGTWSGIGGRQETGRPAGQARRLRFGRAAGPAIRPGFASGASDQTAEWKSRCRAPTAAACSAPVTSRVRKPTGNLTLGSRNTKTWYWLAVSTSRDSAG